MAQETSPVKQMTLINQLQKLVPRTARLYDDTKGIEAISPGLPESARATPGPKAIQPITFARSAASEASIFPLASAWSANYIT